MVKVAIVGVGFMGWIHYLAYQRCQSAKLVAFCSRDAKKRAGDWRGIQGNFGPPGEQIDVSGLSAYESLDGILADDSVELVDICLPPHLHGDAVSRSLAAGKHVLCEKPLALTATEAQALADGAGGRLMVAQILPFFAEYQLLSDAVADGRYGKLLGGHFKRVIGPPDWIPDFYDPTTVGGPLIDLHVHDAHLIRMLIGMPTQAYSVCRMKAGVPKYVETIFRFADPDLVAGATSGVIDQGSRGFTHGYDVQFEKANIQFESAAFGDGSGAAIPLTIAHSDGRVERPTDDSADAADSIAVFAKELDAAARSVTSGKVHPALDAAVAVDAIKICEMQIPKR
jgi:predicted dehydrogenase